MRFVNKDRSAIASGVYARVPSANVCGREAGEGVQKRLRVLACGVWRREDLIDATNDFSLSHSLSCRGSTLKPRAQRDDLRRVLRFQVKCAKGHD